MPPQARIPQKKRGLPGITPWAIPARDGGSVWKKRLSSGSTGRTVMLNATPADPGRSLEMNQ